MSFNKGSEWRKWDLHVHTPDSIVHGYKKDTYGEVWDRYFHELENLPSDIKVLGINDYWFLDGYKKVKEYKDKGGLQNIDLLLPVIEVRLRDFVGSSQLNKINYHIIFSDVLTVEEIEEEFLKRIEIHEFDNRILSENNLRKFGEKIRDETPPDKKDNLPSSLQIGFNNFTVQLEKINELLKKKCLKNKFIRVIGQTEWSDFRWDGSPSDKKSLINGCDFVFSASPTIEKANKSKISLTEQGVNDTFLHCSDAHEFYKDKFTSKVLGHCYTWIKANPTFEGLKQVIYEPKHRVAIQENKPNEALHKLETIELSFDNTIKWGSDKFCFAGFNEPIVLSPHLTCIIGGRGSGKSTLLNLVAENIGKKTNFFNDLKVNIPDYIKFEPEVVENIEFLAQNTIESFATDSQKFTQAIFERIDKNANGELSNIEDDINDGLKIFDDQILRFKTRDDLDKKLKEKNEDLVKNQNIVKTFKDTVYIDNKNKLQEVQKKIIEIESSREKYEELFMKIKDIHKLDKVIENNKYDEYFNSLFDDLDALYEKYKKYNYDVIKKELKSHQENKNKYTQEIEKYLKDKGLSEENVKDAQLASSNIEIIENDIIKLTKQKTLIEDELTSFSFVELDTKITDFKITIEEELEKINLKFQNISAENTLEVKAIKVEYKLNEDIFDTIFEELTEKLDINQEIKSFYKAIKTYLQDVDIDTVLEISNTSELIEKIDKRKTQAYQFLTDIFQVETKFSIYKLIIEKNKRDIKNKKLLKVFYDDKTLDNSSFGQKCTTAIVVLLSLGNTPIIIDEPEAHLDSSLIANYLVELIKEQKEHRQIIFATHNANFVLNADAELVIKLQNDSGLTSINSFSIEDLEYREDLLRLEGGAEAFRKREKKYNISSYE